MQPISGPILPSIQPQTGGVAAPSGTAMLNVVGGISQAMLGGAVSTGASSSVSLSGTSLCSALGGSIGALLKANEEEVNREDWMQELSDCELSPQDQARQFMHGLTQDMASPGELGVPVPGFDSQELRELVGRSNQ